jgi:hypothetical protein
VIVDYQHRSRHVAIVAHLFSRNLLDFPDLRGAPGKA